jgi:hypothetical protein
MPQILKGYRSWQDNGKPQAEQADNNKKPDG